MQTDRPVVRVCQHQLSFLSVM